MKRPWIALLVGIVIVGLEMVIGFHPYALAAAGEEALAGSADASMSAAAAGSNLLAESAALPMAQGGALFSASATSVATYEAVTFDASLSRSPQLVVLYEWDFDGNGMIDAVAASPVIDHAYAEDGVFAVRLTTIDGQGLVAASVVPVEIAVANRAPSAAMTVPQGIQRAQIPMPFDGAASSDVDGAIVAWQWEYGDGRTGEGPNPIHTYEVAGMYVARLTVTDEDGATASIESPAIRVEDAPPSAGFSIEVPSSSEALAVWFVDTTVVANPMNIVLVSWDFGDGIYRAGGPSTDGVYLHVYALPGEYVVTLYVIDKYGSMSIVRQSVWIRD